MKNSHIRCVNVNSKWFLEENTKDEGSFHSLKGIVYTGKSLYQRIEIILTGSYGKALVLDGKMQSTEVDEFIYHEALVHPALVTVGDPVSVLIAGGGEGATAREVLRYPSVKSVDVVDLDREVVEVSIKHLQKWHQGAYSNEKVRVHFDDARKFIENSKEVYDVIIADLPEPFEESPANLLYTQEFYLAVKRCLSSRGVFVTQATATTVNNLQAYTAITSTLKSVFPIVRPYTVNVPSFHSPWGFVFASCNADPLSLDQETIKGRIAFFADGLNFYDSHLHHSLFCLPKYIIKALDQQDKIITDASPVYFY